MEVPGTGDHCGYATFDFDLFEDESWEGQKINADDASQNHDRVGISAQFNTSQHPKAKQGKMEKSFFNFKTAHPEWKCSSSGQDLIDRMETYQAEQATALARERQHHITAAARQLETLLALEEEQSIGHNKSTLNYETRVDENYVGVQLSTEEIGEKEKTGADSKTRTVQFKDEVVPSTDMTSSAVRHRSNQSIAASILNYSDIGGLSTELKSILNRSTLDPSSSLLLNDLDKSVFKLDRQSTILEESNNGHEQLQEKYMWLEKYHSDMQPKHDSSTIAEDIEK